MEKIKNRYNAFAIWSILVGVFNALVFILVKDKSPVFWVGYGFAMAAFAFQLITAYAICGRKPSLKSVVIGIPLVWMSWLYLIIQLILSTILILIGGERTTLPWVLEILLTAAFLVTLLASAMAKVHIDKEDDSVAAKRFYLGSLQTDVQTLADSAQSAALRLALKNLSQTIRYSDPMSHESLASLENQIERMVYELSEQVRANDEAAAQETIIRIERSFADRNRKCKMLK